MLLYEDSTPLLATVCGAPACADCSQLRIALTAAGIGFIEVDIDTANSARSAAEHTTGGHATVPLVVLPDGTTLMNPAIHDVLLHIVGR